MPKKTKEAEVPTTRDHKFKIYLPDKNAKTMTLNKGIRQFKRELRTVKKYGFGSYKFNLLKEFKEKAWGIAEEVTFTRPIGMHRRRGER